VTDPLIRNLRTLGTTPLPTEGSTKLAVSSPAPSVRRPTSARHALLPSPA